MYGRKKERKKERRRKNCVLVFMCPVLMEVQV
jgi:hypothetical protein